MFSPGGFCTISSPMLGGVPFFIVFSTSLILKSSSRLANGAFDPHQMTIPDVFQAKSSPNVRLVMPKRLPWCMALVFSSLFYRLLVFLFFRLFRAFRPQRSLEVPRSTSVNIFAEVLKGLEGDLFSQLFQRAFAETVVSVQKRSSC